ncbi:phosphate ABC transporter permease PstA [Tabrizicola sp. J26]|uniref:phosphate ABC transporter permease PstA n=1 Tax=Alitabrizicola rongguiensis TaxID=2909234 RepID=UPI001F48AD40|nr:phosphate ABC transporter permease PstA [Tabrizicola rongguiensis]MCF1709722.1 phosphate ABC transporter permease PstA [Tabrizicola rongguiensis]
MTDISAAPASGSHRGSLLVQDELTRKRNAAETRFRLYGIVAISIAMLALAALLISIFSAGMPAFRQTFVTIPIELPADKLDKSGTRDSAVMAKVTTVGYAKVINEALAAALAAKGISTDGMTEKQIAGLLSPEAPAQLRNYVLANPAVVGTSLPEFELLANGRVDGFFKGRVTMESAKLDSNITPEQLQVAQKMTDAGLMGKRFNWAFITAPDASDQRPEAAGLGVAILGSLYMMIVVLVLSLPIGVAAAVYLEEFAVKNFWTDLIEVNIANLAAVPSIVFGILGLAVFINFAGLPQSAPIVGGLVLTLMTLPRIIIPARAALKAVPPSIRDAALGVGASKVQSVFHHVLPLAAPGILTGMIIGLAQALGETAPLLLIGMVAFVRDYPGGLPGGLFDPATALPVQVYSWTTRGDPGFVERASGAIIVLLVFLLIMNAVAIVLRRRFERRW